LTIDDQDGENGCRMSKEGWKATTDDVIMLMKGNEKTITESVLLFCPMSGTDILANECGRTRAVLKPYSDAFDGVAKGQKSSTLAGQEDLDLSGWGSGNRTKPIGTPKGPRSHNATCNGKARSRPRSVV